jgi:hypothetical protein
MRAPAGGMIVQNLYYPGGKLLPKEATEQPKQMKAADSDSVVSSDKPASDWSSRLGDFSHFGFSTNNVGQLDFNRASKELNKEEHHRHKDAIINILQGLGLESKNDFRVYPGIGDWGTTPEDYGAENVSMHVIKTPIDQDTSQYVASKIGLPAKQISVLTFRPHPDGDHRMIKVHFPKADVGMVRKALSDAGIYHRTIVPGKKGWVTAFVVEPFGKEHHTMDAMQKISSELGDGKVDSTNGAAEFVGSQKNRMEAAREYQRIIDSFEGKK